MSQQLQISYELMRENHNLLTNCYDSAVRRCINEAVACDKPVLDISIFFRND